MNYTFSNKIKSLKPSAIREILKNSADKSVISLAAGNPAAESFPVEKMSAISKEIYDNEAIAALQYSITEGFPPLIKKVSNRLKAKFNIGKDFDSTIITTGGQQGIDLSCKVLCNEGDTVICENPSFIGALNSFRAYNVNLVGVELDDEGINIELLKKAVKENKNVKMLYLIPTFQNPSGKTMSLNRRKEVYDFCLKNNIIILEDNPYGELRFSGDEIPTLKAMDTNGIVIYCSSFSKILSAGMRVGFVCAPQDIIAKIVVAKQVNDVHTNIYFQMLINKFFEKYDMDEHIEFLRKLYKDKKEAMINAIEKYFPKEIKYTNPDGGLFLWCTLPNNMNSFDFSKIAIEKKVAIVPGNAFLADESSISDSFRLNYSTPSIEQIEQGIKILGEVLTDYIK